MDATQQQINISYLATEDRLLLKVSARGEEFRVWLTRRFTRMLLDVLAQQLRELGGTQESASQELAGKLKAGAFEKKYDPGETLAYPLGQDGVLGHTIKVSKPVAASINMLLLPETGKGLNLKLDKSKLSLLSNLLEQALATTGWQLSSEPVSRQLMH